MSMQPGDPLRGDGPPPPPTTDRPESAGYTTTPPPGAGGPPVATAPGAIAGRYVLAGWWSRVGAQIVDGLIVFIGGGALAVAIMAWAAIGFFVDDSVGVVSIIVGALISVVCVAVVSLLYAPALMARTNGKTFGRMVTGIRVVRANGKPIDFGFAVLREVVVKTLLIGIGSSLTGGLLGLADVLWPLWDEENRALHDYVVNTRSIVDR